MDRTSGITSDSCEQCPSCLKSVSDEDFAVKCDGFCANWFHCKCVLINDDEYEHMRLLADKSKWYCGPCDFRLAKVIDKLNDIDGVFKPVFNC